VDHTPKQSQEALIQMRHIIVIVMFLSFLKLFGCSSTLKKTNYPTDEELKKSIEAFENRTIYKKLTPEIISKIKDDDLEQAVYDNIAAKMMNDEREEIEIVKSLTTGQRAIYVVWVITGQIDNGGFNQFYFNSTRQFAEVGEEAFKTIGSEKRAALLNRANQTYNKSAEVLKKYNDGTIEGFSKSYEENLFDKLDEEFYKLEEEESLRTLIIKYIRSNMNEFISR
jgi:hypothetical protein